LKPHQLTAQRHFARWAAAIAKEFDAHERVWQPA
jgi:hypothetical protein